MQGWRVRRRSGRRPGSRVRTGRARRRRALRCARAALPFVGRRRRRHAQASRPGGHGSQHPTGARLRPRIPRSLLADDRLSPPLACPRGPRADVRRPSSSSPRPARGRPEPWHAAGCRRGLRARERLRVDGPHTPKTVPRRLAHGSMLHRWRGLQGPSKPFKAPRLRAGGRPEAPTVAAQASPEPMLESPPLPIACGGDPFHRARSARVFESGDGLMAAGRG